jgi:acetyl esterase/lipase
VRFKKQGAMKMVSVPRRLGRALAWLAVLAGAALAQAAPPPAAAFFGNPDVRWMGLSPDGRQIAMTAPGEGGRVGLFIADVERPTEFRPIAIYENSDVDNAYWVGHRLVFTAVDLDLGSGWDRRLAHGLFVIDAAGGRTRQLVSRSGSTRVVLGGGNYAPLTWNHRLLHLPTSPDADTDADADEIIVGETVYSGRDEIDRVVPAWLNLRTGVKRPLTPTGQPEHAMRWWFAPDGQPRVLMTQHRDRSAIYWHGPGDAGWRQLAEADTLNLPWSPVAVDGRGLLYVTQAGPGGTSRMLRWNVEANRPEGEPLAAPAGFDFNGTLVLSKGSPVGVRLDAERESTLWLDPLHAALQNLVDAQWPGRVNHISCRRCKAADAVVLVHSHADRDPGQWTLLRRQEVPGGDPQWLATALARERAAIAPEAMATVELYRVKARDGRELPVWLTRPAASAPGQPLPAVVLVHGGPWVRGGFWRWGAMEQFLASRGYLVISPEFRGSQGYGEDFFRAGWRQWGRVMQDDLVDALHWAQARGLAGKDACIAGASYGGYATLMGLVRDDDVFRCGAAWVAPADLMLLLEGSWWMDDDISSTARTYGLKRLVGDADADRDALLAASPLAQAARIKAPLLLAYGESDTRVPLAHGTRLRRALTDAGHPPDWVSYAGEGHSWRLAATRIDFAERLEAFLARNLSAPR